MLLPLTHTDPVEIAHFRLLARLGHGGMGTVYLARTAGGRTVALKTMHASIATDLAARTRFHLETDAARIIGGHHGATVVAADPQAETPWLATEYVLGPPLDDAVALCGPLPESSVRALGAALAGALTQLHASDVVHRDLKPSNVMVTAYGPKIIDFGIARAAGDDRLTRTGSAAGTPAFMSPEQATGQEQTPAGDVFALAGVLVFAATGHGPFGTGQAADLLYRVRYSDPDLTGLPTSLTRILRRCLSKDPSQRPTTYELAGELHDGQGQFADHLAEPVLADIARRATGVWQHPPGRLPAPPEHKAETSPSAPVVARRKLLTTGAGGILGTAVIGTGLWAWLGRSGDGTSGKEKPGTAAPPKTSAPPKGDWLWRLPIRTSTAHVPPVPHSLGGYIAVVDDNGLRVIDVEEGGLGIPVTSSAAPHQCVTDGDSVLYTCEPSSADAGPLRIKTVEIISQNLSPEPVEYKEFNGGLPGTQMLCASADVVYLAAGQGNHSGTGLGFDTAQNWFLLAVDRLTAKVVWRQELPKRPATSHRLHFLAARITGEHLVLLQETSGGKVVLSVRDSRTGKVRWEQPLTVSAPDDVRGMLEVDPVNVYPPAGPLRALNLNNGKEEWRLRSGATRRTGPPALLSIVVYAVEEGKGLLAVSALNGEPMWREKDGRAADADLRQPPLPGLEFTWYHSESRGGLHAVSRDTGKAGRTSKAPVSRFFPFRGSPERIIALGEDFIAGYELK
ncbi:protein kinase domain-containing protein [Streptomyces xantholiticus]|uniref:Protein kinase n=1 Tax=Streptomyces xantholiticus TaxID=68285 RepID=A0ABV1V0F8_9ACTN